MTSERPARGADDCAAMTTAPRGRRGGSSSRTRIADKLEPEAEAA